MWSTLERLQWPYQHMFTICTSCDAVQKEPVENEWWDSMQIFLQHSVHVARLLACGVHEDYERVPEPVHIRKLYICVRAWKQIICVFQGGKITLLLRKQRPTTWNPSNQKTVIRNVFFRSLGVQVGTWLADDFNRFFFGRGIWCKSKHSLDSRILIYFSPRKTVLTFGSATQWVANNQKKMFGDIVGQFFHSNSESVVMEVFDQGRFLQELVFTTECSEFVADLFSLFSATHAVDPLLTWY